MTSGFNRQQIVSDYSHLLSTIVPGYRGFYCYDRHGNKFCEHAPEQSLEQVGAYVEALHEVLADPDQARECGRVEHDNQIAFIIPFTVHAQSMLGAFTVVACNDEPMSYQQASRLIKPVANNMHKELNLSFRLMNAHKKLTVLSAEEHLLHEIEKLVHKKQSSDDTLKQIVRLCRQLLDLSGVALIVPDKQIRVVDGDTPKPAELRVTLNDLMDSFSADPESYPAVSADSGDSNDGTMILNRAMLSSQEQLHLPILMNRREPIGVLALNGWHNAGFSAHRRQRIGRYVTAHIEDVILRDYDLLTGLMDWNLFELRFAADMAAQRSGSKVAETLIALNFDIDRLHVINENLGPERGDEMLKAFADLLRERIGNQAVTRISSDQFAAIMKDTDIDEARAVAEEIRSEFAKLEFTNGTKKERASVSIGIGPVSEESMTASSAIALAQVACKAAKDRGRGRVEAYVLDDQSIIQRMDDIQLVGDIRSAIDSGRLSVYAQPIVALNGSSDLNYFEALVRLVDASGQHVPPGEFFSSAERYQLMEELDRWVITETLSKIAEHQGSSPGKPLRVAINLSGQSLGSAQFLPFVQDAIKRFGVAPESLCFEITETVAIANLQRAQHFMHTLKKHGCLFSLDDFGTGLSSFSYLKLFPISTLKIDGSFVSDITSNVVSQSVVAAISEVARVMELDTVAEYVPDDGAINLLRDLGVTWGQGFMLGEPEPLEATLKRIGGAIGSLVTA